jgi:hypothetical protein
MTVKPVEKRDKTKINQGSGYQIGVQAGKDAAFDYPKMSSSVLPELAEHRFKTQVRYKYPRLDYREFIKGFYAGLMGIRETLALPLLEVPPLDEPVDDDDTDPD